MDVFSIAKLQHIIVISKLFSKIFETNSPETCSHFVIDKYDITPHRSMPRLDDADARKATLFLFARYIDLKYRVLRAKTQISKLR